MTKVVFFLGTTEVSVVPEIELDLDAMLVRQSDLLQCWQAFGAEITRRVYDLPLDLRFEMEELDRLSDEITNAEYQTEEQ